MKPILTTELTLNEHPTKSSFIERLSGYAEILAELYHIQADDVVLIASNSGRNAYPIELALEAKKRGAKVIGITSVAHSNATTSRHASGKHLLDIADVVIDNCGVPGDCSVKNGRTGHGCLSYFIHGKRFYRTGYQCTVRRIHHGSREKAPCVCQPEQRGHRTCER